MASINLATMASTNTANKSTRFFPSHPHHSATFCTRIHQIAALALVVATFFLTRLFDHSLGPCFSPHFNSFADVNRQYDGVLRFGDSVGWPDRGYGTHLNLKIYVYDENEIEGLKLLLYGREGKISPEACIKGQWGTQVIWSGNVCFPFLIFFKFFFPLTKLGVLINLGKNQNYCETFPRYISFLALEQLINFILYSKASESQLSG